MQSLLGERWVLLADVTNSTRFFWELKQAARQKPEDITSAALFKGGSLYSAGMESIFGRVASTLVTRWAMDSSLSGNTGMAQFISQGTRRASFNGRMRSRPTATGSSQTPKR